MGGMTALVLGPRHGDRFDRSIPCDCGPASTPQSAQPRREPLDLGGRKGRGALVDVTMSRWIAPHYVGTGAPVLGKLRGMIRTTPYQGFAGCAHALSDYDLKPGLAGIKNPVLLMCGTKDATYPGIQAINAAVPGSQRV